MLRKRISWLLGIIVLAGCSTSDQRILEELGFTHTTSYDLISQEEGASEDEKLKITISIPKADPDAEDKREVLTATGRTSKEARIQLSKMTNRTLVSGQLRNILYGSELARAGIWEHIDTLIRDPSIGQRVKITLVDGSAHDLLAKEYPDHPITGVYIAQMLDKEAKYQTVPDTNLYHFVRDYFDDGIDPVAPVMKDHGDHVDISGIGLFQDDRYVTKIATQQTMIFALLRGGFKQGEISIQLDDGSEGREFVFFSSLSSKRKVKVLNPKPPFSVEIHVTARASVLEYIGDLKPSEVPDQEKLERKISDYLQQEAQKMVEMMQKHQVDSLGIGKDIRNHMSFKEWSELDWREAYAQMEIRCNVQAEIKDYGKFQ
ncbi:Ger(x)C family spore germination protein [Xylanibacillus composti]|uniref:Germination protein n=1 Tax=Xylanibacillus composti TaxID=1572762 RepID=A0A8J4H229_9BACL|nr:Ger(x)C family spore germination protein [Xylanibacillus composti]GIQ69527.1 germination protein [Xylanibacillus composti]